MAAAAARVHVDCFAIGIDQQIVGWLFVCRRQRHYRHHHLIVV